MNKHFIYFFLFLLPYLSCAQQYKTDWYTPENGLPQSSVKDIVKDKYGFIWLSTENGMARFDGINFEIYNNFTVNNHNLINFFGAVSRDSILIKNAFDENLLVIKERKATVFKGNWKNKILKHVHSKEFQPYVKKTFSDKIDPKINFYIQCKEGTYYFDKETFYYQNHKTNEEISIPLSLNTISLNDCFAFNESIFYIDRNSKKIIQIQKGTISYIEANPLLFSKNSKLYWSQVNNQFFIFNNNELHIGFLEKNRLNTQKLIHSIPFDDNGIFSIYYDPNYSKLYIGTPADGLCIMTFQKFKGIKKSNSVEDAIVYAHLPFDKNSIIDPKGIVFNKNGVVKDFNFQGITDKYSMTYDAQGNIWVKSYFTLYKYEKEKNYTLTDSLRSKVAMESIYNFEDFNAICYIENGFYGVLKLYKKEGFKEEIQKFKFEKNINYVKKISSDSLLVGTRDGLYSVAIKKNEIHRIDKINSFNVRNIIKTSSGNVWILSAGKGFYLLKGKELIKMPLDKKKSLQIVHCILEDKNNAFWISTNNGLFKIQETELIKHVKDSKYSVKYYEYNKHDGFNTNEFNGGCTPNGTILKNGAFIFPSLDGFVFFNPDSIKNYYPNKKIFVEKARINNKKIEYFKKTLYLENDFYRVDLYVDAPYFSKPDNLYREAWIDGKSHSWESIEKNGIFSITNLEYGTYTIKFRMLTSATGDYSYDSIKLIVAPLFYQTLAFKISVCIIILFFLYLIYKFRSNYLIKKNSALEKIVNERTLEIKKTVINLEKLKEQLKKESIQQKKLIGSISHDITTPIKYLSITAQNLYYSDENDVKLKKKYLESLYKSSLELYNFTMALKDYAVLYSAESKSASIAYNLNELVQEKVNLFSSISKDKKIEILNRVNKNLTSNISKNIIAVIIHNLIDNAVKYTDSGSIYILASETIENLIIEVSDTGIGMSIEQIKYYENLQINVENEKLLLQKYGIGLNLVLQLLNIINGTISFNSINNKGTSVKISIKK